VFDVFGFRNRLVAYTPHHYRLGVTFVLVALLMSSLAPVVQRVCAQMGTMHAQHMDATAPCCHAEHAGAHHDGTVPCPESPDRDSEPDCEDRSHSTSPNATLGTDQCCDLHLDQHTAEATAPRVVLVPAPYSTLASIPAVAIDAPPERRARALSSRGPPRTATTPLFLQHAALLR
jgi:hypothetical protein